MPSASASIPWTGMRVRLDILTFSFSLVFYLAYKGTGASLLLALILMKKGEIRGHNT
jgi:hypothetical protein